MKQWLKKNTIWIFFFVILLASDLLTKWLAVQHFKNPIALIPGFLELNLSYNAGIAFSISIPNGVMVISTPLLLFLILFFILRSCEFKYAITKLVLVLLLAGGTSNFINRIWTSSVIDFIDFSFWPSFNLADSYLTIGVFLILIFYGKIARKNNYDKS